jgi:hypothetical protein
MLGLRALSKRDTTTEPKQIQCQILCHPAARIIRRNLQFAIQPSCRGPLVHGPFSGMFCVIAPVMDFQIELERGSHGQRQKSSFTRRRHFPAVPPDDRNEIPEPGPALPSASGQTPFATPPTMLPAGRSNCLARRIPRSPLDHRRITSRSAAVSFASQCDIVTCPGAPERPISPPNGAALKRETHDESPPEDGRMAENEPRQHERIRQTFRADLESGGRRRSNRSHGRLGERRHSSGPQ